MRVVGGDCGSDSPPREARDEVREGGLVGGRARRRALPPQVLTSDAGRRRRDVKRGPGPWAGPRYQPPSSRSDGARKRTQISKQTKLVSSRGLRPLGRARERSEIIAKFQRADHIRGDIRQQATYQGAHENEKPLPSFFSSRGPHRLCRLLLCAALSFDRQQHFLLTGRGLAGLLAFGRRRLGCQTFL
jgi:hypothetical protein